MDGPILTNAPLDTLADCMRRGGYTALKVVTGWGVPGGWTDGAIRRAVGMAPDVIVRTVMGDPSYGGNINRSHWFLQPEAVLREVDPWLRVRGDLLVELGNEPNVIDSGPDSDGIIWVYRWFLNETITALRARYPRVRLISPAPIMDVARRPDRWFAILADSIRRCDYVGLHAYEHTNWMGAPPTTGDLGRCIAAAQQLAPGRPWLLTEYGINGSTLTDAEKGARYAALRFQAESRPTLPSNIAGALYYHLDTSANPLQPQYVIYPSGDEAFRRVRELATRPRSIPPR